MLQCRIDIFTKVNYLNMYCPTTSRLEKQQETLMLTMKLHTFTDSFENWG